MEGFLAVARDFAKQALGYRTKPELKVGLDACVRELGFRYFAILHHVDPRKRHGAIIHLDSYPESWAEYFIKARLYLYDPILRASLATNLGFLWEEVSNLIHMRPNQYQILEAARRAGIYSGFTVPAHIPGEAHGSCSFANANCRVLSTDCQLAAQLVGGFAFQAARRICRASCPLRPYAAQLTPRQRDCVELVAQGKTDWEISKILGLKKDSVTKVVDAARLRYNVANRTELVVAALFDGQISFNEVRHWQYRFDRSDR